MVWMGYTFTDRDTIYTIQSEGTYMEKEIELIINATHDAMIAVDTKGHITLFNQAAERLTRQRSQDVIGRPVVDVITTTRLPEVLKSGQAELNRRQHLEDVEIITSRMPLVDEKGSVLGAVAIFRDISEMVVLAEEITNLKEIRGMLEAVFNCTQDAISVVNQHGYHVLINPAYSRLTGLTEQEVIGKQFSVDIAEESSGDSVHWKVLETQKPVDGVVLRLGKHRKEVVASAAPLLVNGELRGSVAVIHDMTEMKRLSSELDQAKQIIRNLEAKYTFADIIGTDPLIKGAISKAEVAAATPATVILRGESGTGKELFAHAIHNASNRRNAQFIRVNCAAISESLLESELFGYEEGAFTGASKGGKTGFFERASGGTIFLDEIGEINISTQAKLLRVLQEKEIVRVGGTKAVPVNVRIISATNLDLERAVEEGKFRRDLYYRLNVIPIEIPPLRQRKSDLSDLVHHIIARFNQEYGRSVTEISGAALDRIRSLDWPGNIRELENYLGRGMINMRIQDKVMDLIHLQDLDGSGRSDQMAVASNVKTGPVDIVPLKDRTEAFEKEYLMRVMKSFEGNKTECAKALGVSIRTLYYKLDRYDLLNENC